MSLSFLTYEKGQPEVITNIPRKERNSTVFKATAFLGCQRDYVVHHIDTKGPATGRIRVSTNPSSSISRLADLEQVISFLLATALQLLK